VVVVVVSLCWQPALAQKGGATAGPRYSVTGATLGYLYVTDNQTNTLYFYSFEKDVRIGELKLRATIDLKQVGKPMIKRSKPKED
jgi:hypothetical protein